MSGTATFGKHDLIFKQPSGTSRGVLKTKTTYFIKLISGASVGYGECGLLKGLSHDDVPDYEEKLQWACTHIHLGLETLWQALIAYPSIQFGLEQAFMSVKASNPFELFPSAFTRQEQPIDINGLIWMGDEAFMSDQIQAVIEKGFSCVKMKIGAIDVDQELALLKAIRARFSKDLITLRVDANGAFSKREALTIMNRLAALEVHSIEQPLAVSKVSDLAALCKETPIPVALDESLIGCLTMEEKERLLDTVKPQYIILKPSFIGGFKGSEAWITLAEERGIGWWATSALESNVGLNAISQWVYLKNTTLPQGLGTGSLYTNNIPSPLRVQEGRIIYKGDTPWETNAIDTICI